MCIRDRDYAYYGGLDKYTDGETFDADLALEYKEKAVAELTEAGCTFPVKVLMRYNPTTTNCCLLYTSRCV